MSRDANMANDCNSSEERSVGIAGIDGVPALAKLHCWQRAVDGVAAWPRTLLLVAVGFQLSVLLGMIAFRAAPHLLGETVLLRVVPVDPRDMFRGDYVTLSYEFTRLSSLPGYGRHGYERRDERSGETIYVSLAPEPDGKHWRATGCSFSRPSQGRFIRGTVAGWDRGQFGIESYFVQEGKGTKYEQAVRQHHLSAVVSLSPDGSAALKGLQVDGQGG
jgi:uncharacterized membrane-anchored protein